MSLRSVLAVYQASEKHAVLRRPDIRRIPRVAAEDAVYEEEKGASAAQLHSLYRPETLRR